jgi:hypothetical protein
VREKLNKGRVHIASLSSVGWAPRTKNGQTACGLPLEDVSFFWDTPTNSIQGPVCDICVANRRAKVVGRIPRVLS